MLAVPYACAASQAATLHASLCCNLLVALDTGASEHAAIQQEADRLLAAC
jgi:hypothetical protein